MTDLYCRDCEQHWEGFKEETGCPCPLCPNGEVIIYQGLSDYQNYEMENPR